jgi:UDP-glucose 4-epimerase
MGNRLNSLMFKSTSAKTCMVIAGSFHPPMKVAVTGVADRIGRAIHLNLCQDHEFVGIDRTVSLATTHIGDIGDFEFMVNAFVAVDAVIHTAAYHVPHVGIIDDAEFIRTNVQGTQTVVRAMRACSVRKLVFASTTALYGYASENPDSAVWLNEQSEPVPKYIYHRSKLEAEAYLQSVSSKDLKVTILRVSRCFPESAPLMAAYRLHRGVDARDVAEGHRLALDMDKAYRMYILSGHTPFGLEDCDALKADAKGVLLEKCPSICMLFAERNWL